MMRTEEASREYLARRDLDVSGEPGGGEPGERPRFVIQRHDASSLHFDFRLEVDGAVHAKGWLAGQKLDGGYALTRTPVGGRDDQWLLLAKADDAGADPRRNSASTQPESVLSGRTNRDLE